MLQGEDFNISDSCGRQQAIRFTNDYHESIWVTRVSFPIFLFVGTLGNVAGIALVLLETRNGRRRYTRALDMSTSRKTFLLSLFITDLCYLWNRLIVLLGIEVWNLHPEAKQLYSQFFTWTHGLWMFLDAVLSFSSKGILVMSCVDRFYALTCPLRHKTSTSFQRTASVVGVIYLASIVCSLILPVLYYSAFHRNQVQKNAPVPAYAVPLQRWRIFDAWLEVFIRIVCVFVILLLNLLIFLKLKKSNMKLPVHVIRSRKSSTDQQLRSIIEGRNSLRPPSSAFIMLLFTSSLFYLATNSMDIVLSMMQVLSIYPICVLQTTMDLVNAYEPARDFLHHTYFAFGFIFYVCLKLRKRGSFSRRSSKPCSSDILLSSNREH